MPTQERKGSNFIVQGGILAITGIISRLIGLLYRSGVFTDRGARKRYGLPSLRREGRCS